MKVLDAIRAAAQRELEKGETLDSLARKWRVSHGYLEAYVNDRPPIVAALDRICEKLGLRLVPADQTEETT